MGAPVPGTSDSGRNLPDESTTNSLPIRPETTNAAGSAGRGGGSLAAAYIALFATIGVYMPFFPVFLAGRGFGPEAIGVAISIPIVVRLLALPVAGVLSDRVARARSFLSALGLLSALGFGIISVIDGPVAIFIALGFAALFWNPAFPLLESYALRLAGRGHIDYGRVRLWGSISFIAANLVAGAALDVLPGEAVIWMIAVPFALFGLSTAWLIELTPGAPVREGEPAAPIPALLIFGVAAAAFVQSSHAVLYAFASVHWAAAGLGSGTIGALWATGVIAEVAVFTVGTRLQGALGARAGILLIAIGSAAAILRFGLLMLDPPATLLFPLQLLHGLTFGASHLGLMGLIAAGAPERAAGRAQTFASTAMGVMMAIATFAAGPLYAELGAAAFGSSALLGLVALALSLAAIVQRRQAGTIDASSFPRK